MVSQTDTSDRRLVPRWRYVGRTVHTAEHAGDPRLRRAFVSSTDGLDQALEEWRRDPVIPTAADAVTTAIVLGEPEAARAPADFLLAHASRTTPDLVDLATWLLNGCAEKQTDAIALLNSSEKSKQEAQQMIRQSRRQLAKSPRNIGCRRNLSLAYAVLGHGDRARAEMGRALSLVPNSRGVLRAMARLLIHLGCSDEAYAIIRRHPRTREDPWLMSQEVTLATILKRPPELALRGRRLVESLQHEPAFITELASANGMLELMAGNHKRGRKMLELSLKEPTDNVIAQAQWASQRDHAIIVPPNVLERPATWEANCLRAMSEQRWTEAINNAGTWQMDEPYSSRPAILGSFLATSILGDPKRGIEFAETGLQADPADQLLRNNYIVALVRAGKLEEARTQFQTIQEPLQSGYPEFVFRATRGLLAFAHGDPEVGRQFYAQAIELAPPMARARVLVNWIETESCYAPADADIMIQRHQPALCKIDDPIISAMLSKTTERHEQRLKQGSLLRRARLVVPPALQDVLKKLTSRL